jgi:hypothetical protein
MEMYLFVHKDLKGLQILTETLQHYFVYDINFNYPSAHWCLEGTITLQFGGRGTRLSGFVTSLA